MKTLALCLRLPAYNLFYYNSRFKILPFSYAVALTSRCNCKCLTCGIPNNKDLSQAELSCNEYSNFFESLGESPFWVTFTGGEPFLRSDIVEIIYLFYKICRPKIMNISTNGTLTENTIKGVGRILDLCRDSHLVLNLSLDGVGEDHDRLRGSPGCYKKTLDTFQGLKKIRQKNFILGINTVLSKYNIAGFSRLCEEIKDLEPDSYTTEIAQEREELNNLGYGIVPDCRAYNKAMDYLKSEKIAFKPTRLNNLKRLMRRAYYRQVSGFLKNQAYSLRCLAGVTSGFVSPSGNISFCCFYTSPVGNLREVDFDFNKIWFADKARERRKMLKDKKCACVLANMFYTNATCDFLQMPGLLVSSIFKR
ncbi:MAG: radical SAM protein [Candidatus Omnitrophica bacterium]|nr:radical SAM protein [Candidatus Omnitrophota bacterium]